MCSILSAHYTCSILNAHYMCSILNAHYVCSISNAHYALKKTTAEKESTLERNELQKNSDIKGRLFQCNLISKRLDKLRYKRAPLLT